MLVELTDKKIEELKDRLNDLDLDQERRAEIKALIGDLFGVSLTHVPKEGDVCLIKTKSGNLFHAVYCQFAPHRYVWVNTTGDNRIVEEDEKVVCISYICKGLQNYWKGK